MLVGKQLFQLKKEITPLHFYLLTRLQKLLEKQLKKYLFFKTKRGEIKMRNRTFSYTFILLIGGLLFFLSEILDRIDSFWGGLGLALIILSTLRLLQLLRIQTNKDYAEKRSIDINDERNIYISKEARSKAFYYSVIIEAIFIFIFTAFDRTEYAKVMSCLFIGQLFIYYVLYFVLRKRI